MKKKCLLFIICLSTLFLLTGCSNKKVITTDEFKEIAEAKEFVITDVKEQYSSDNIVEATVASNEFYQVEFYVLNNEENAKNMFKTNKNSFEDTYKNNRIVNSVSIKNYDYYSLQTNDNYVYICRVDNTFIYTNANKKYKDEVKEFIKELGY